MAPALGGAAEGRAFRPWRSRWEPAGFWGYPLRPVLGGDERIWHGSRWRLGLDVLVVGGSGWPVIFWVLGSKTLGGPVAAIEGAVVAWLRGAG